MKMKRMLAMVTVLMSSVGAMAEIDLNAVLQNNSLTVEWRADSEGVLTVYRNGWPLSVCAVEANGSRTIYVDGNAGDYSVRLKTLDECEKIDAQEPAGDVTSPTLAPTSVPTPAPTAIPTPVPTAEPTVVPTAAPTVMPTAVPTTVPTAEPTFGPISSPGQSMTSMAAQVVSEVNVERQKAGLSPLVINPELTAAACIRAQEIVEKFSHTRPDGSSWSTVSSVAYGENIAKGQNSASKVMAAWMSSDGHRSNILRSSFGSIGVCALQVDGVMYWVQLFGK